MSGKHTENLNRHIKRKHVNIYDEIVSKKQKAKKTTVNSITKYVDHTITPSPNVTITKKALLDGCVELVTKNGRPLKMLEDSGFKKIIDPLCKAVGLTINRQNIKEEIVKRAAARRIDLKSRFENRLISIKVDCVSRLDRSIIGINAQFIENGKIEIKTLAMKEIYIKHTSLNLSNVIIGVLESFGIDLSRVYSLTVDNAPNMIGLGKYLKNPSRKIVPNVETEVVEEVTELDCTDDPDDDEYDSDENNDANNDAVNNVDVNNADQNNNGTCNEYISKIFQEFESELETIGCINIIRCAAHTLNLAVSDFIKDVKEIRAKAKTVVKKLRTPTLLNLLHTKKLRKPVIENVTRWGSTYNMLRRLLDLKHFCIESAKDIKELHLNANEWQQIENVCDVLCPAYNMSLKLQNNNLLLSDMFYAWYSCKIKVEKKSGWLNLRFANALKIRGEFLNHPCVFAAVYLDPRYQILLSDSEKDLAKKHLIETFELKSKILNVINVDESSDSIVSADDELDSILEQLDRTINTSKKSIVDIINCFDNTKRVSSHTNILNFWQNYAGTELKGIAEIVLAAPATQVSVERAFSTLKFILSDLRASIDEELLEDILLLNLNE